MYCTNCGKEIKDGSLFCSECGAAQTETEPEQPNGYWEYSGNNWTGGGSGIPYNKMCIIGVILSGISLIFPIIGIAGFLLSGMGFKQIAETGERGKELAIAGMAVGAITGVLSIISLLAAVGVVSSLRQMFWQI